MRLALSTLMVTLALCAHVSHAHAQLSAGGMVGYGVGIDTDPDPHGLLAGGRAGWNFDKFYLGANVVFFAGDKSSNRFATTTFRQIQILGIDAGYDLEVGPLILRPVFGFGGSMGLVKVGGRKKNQGAGFINFGLEAHYPLNDLVFVGGGSRFLSTFFDPDNVNAVHFYGLLGVTLDFSDAPPPQPVPAPPE